ncbi:MAG: hypothetical protein WDW36_007569 [Sanguina aurantia]
MDPHRLSQPPPLRTVTTAFGTRACEQLRSATSERRNSHQPAHLGSWDPRREGLRQLLGLGAGVSAVDEKRIDTDEVAGQVIIRWNDW